MKKMVIITPFDNYSYQVRIKYVERYLMERGYDVKIISSDFDHRNKEKYSSNRSNLELINVPSYKKNISYARINSHKVFAKKVLGRLEQLDPELIYCSAPPNYLFKYTSVYKKKHPGVKLIYELGDLWPETLPLQEKVMKLAAPVLNIWSGLRDKNICFADGIIYECQMFSDVVSKFHPGVRSEVIYLSKEDYYKGEFLLDEIPDKTLRFAYVGSINNIIDIDLIVEILRKIGQKRDVELVVIGGGESAHKLFSLCDAESIKYENHGVVYDDEAKHQILCTCHFGLNIMKNSVVVGATMKSLEYFHEGLILVNNIAADSTQIIDKYECGFNIVNGVKSDIYNDIAVLDHNKINVMRNNSRKAYEELFDSSIINNRLDILLSGMGV